MITAFIMVYSLAFIWRNLHKHKPRTVKTAQVSPAEIQRQQKAREKAQKDAEREEARRQREEEKAIKAEQAREQAANDYDRLTAQRETVLALCEAIETELAGNITDQRRTQLLSKLVTNENRLASIDRRRDKAYSAAYYAA